ncbi:MAG: hypothetical protein JW922_04980 [Paludibacteraceae bacterium]|nr:hypothetical protein [Paludibacteraceae bacterium]
MDYFDQEGFKKEMNKEGKMTKTNYINKTYFQENMITDYSPLFEEHKDKVLHIHGDKDDKVPIESLDIVFNNRIIVKGGKHDLERPDLLDQWLCKAVEFISQ